MTMDSSLLPSRQFRLEDLFCSRAYSAISDLLCSHLNMVDILSLCQVSKAFYEVRDEKTHLTISILLREFVSSPNMFRFKQRQHNALISGCFALNFFEMGRWQVANLDLFVKAGDEADALIDYIQEHEGYETGQEIVAGAETASECLMFHSDARPAKTIRLLRTPESPLQSILLSSSNTASVNLISWNKAYSLFPVQTIIQHKFYALRILDNEFGSMLAEQGHQGWTTRDMVWPDLSGDCHSRVSCGHRKIGDRYSLVLPLKLQDQKIQQVTTPNFEIECAQFEVFTEDDISMLQERNTITRIRLQDLSSPALRHGYTFSSRSWYEFAVERLQRWTEIELYKLEPDRRPQQFADGVPDRSEIVLPQDFKMPEAWDYADDQLPQWYLEWYQTFTDPKDRRDRNRNRRRRAFS